MKIDTLNTAINNFYTLNSDIFEKIEITDILKDTCFVCFKPKNNCNLNSISFMIKRFLKYSFSFYWDYSFNELLKFDKESGCYNIELLYENVEFDNRYLQYCLNNKEKEIIKIRKKEFEQTLKNKAILSLISFLNIVKKHNVEEYFFYKNLKSKVIIIYRCSVSGNGDNIFYFFVSNKKIFNKTIKDFSKILKSSFLIPKCESDLENFKEHNDFLNIELYITDKDYSEFTSSLIPIFLKKKLNSEFNTNFN